MNHAENYTFAISYFNDECLLFECLLLYLFFDFIPFETNLREYSAHIQHSFIQSYEYIHEFNFASVTDSYISYK